MFDMIPYFAIIAVLYMTEITVVGAGVYGSRIAEKYRKFDAARIKAVVSRHAPKAEPFKNVPFCASATSWKEHFGVPNKNDVFDLCVHPDVLVAVFEEFIKIGAKNFVLPKPIALNRKDLSKIRQLASRNKLNLLVASQWYYSTLVGEVYDFIKKYKKEISSVSITFSRSFELARKDSYTPVTAFLPHILQILFSTKLINERSKSVIENFSDKKLKIRYDGKIKIKVESDLSVNEKVETMKIFLKGGKKPALTANFSGVFEKGGFVEYPSVTIFGKKRQVKEDLLENMIKNFLDYFGGNVADKKSLTFKEYFPIAKEEVHVIEQGLKSVVVIGGGIFGTMSALEIARKGYSVLVLEKESQIITGASLVNQCRVHMGYHYPRDEKTAKDSFLGEAVFKKFFNKAIVKNVHNYYLIAKEGSLTSPKDFVAFCDKMELSYKKSWPVKMDMSKEKIALSLKVPEEIFDAHTIRDILRRKIEASPNITCITSAEVIGINKRDKGFEIQYKKEGVIETTYCGAAVNATYGNVNRINNLLGLPLKDYQYELCEEFVVKTPWGKTGWAIMDGPFFGIMPFGFSKNHIFYDVELSVLERVVGKLPQFKFDMDYYKDKKRTEQRFKKYNEKWKPWVPDIEKCKQVSSLFVTRIVLPKRDKTDARPTVVEELLPGFWQIFSGKITTSVPQSIEIGELVDKFLKKKR